MVVGGLVVWLFCCLVVWWFSGLVMCNVGIIQTASLVSRASARDFARPPVACAASARLCRFACKELNNQILRLRHPAVLPFRRIAYVQAMHVATLHLQQHLVEVQVVTNKIEILTRRLKRPYMDVGRLSQ